MQARTVTDIEGGSVEIIYTSDPKTIDGLSQEEIVTTILGLIPTLLYATTYINVSEADLADYLRSHADVWDPPSKEDIW